MKQRYAESGILVCVVGLLLICTSELFAQRFVDVPAGYGTLQSVLKADSVNRAANPNTIYRLHRGNADSVYYLTNTLTNWRSMPLQIQSSGSGQLPSIILATLSDGTAISPMIAALANISIKGVFLNGVNTLGVPVDRIMRIQANGVTVTLDSCQANRTVQSFIRVDNTNARIFLKNCRISNIFSDWSNARVIDNRGIKIDTLSIVGSSFYRIGQCVYRDGGGILTYGYFNHNTFTEINQILSLGNALNITYTNNLAVNCMFLGQGKSSIQRALFITPLPGVGQTAYVTRNIFYADTTSLYAAYHTSSDSVVFSPVFADTLVTMIKAAGFTSTNISSPVTFTLPPNNVVKAIKIDSIARWYWRNPVVNGADASLLNIDSIKYVNLAYNTGALAYTYGTDGKPVGATEWFGIALSVDRDQTRGIPTEFQLEPNYPNPFNPSTTIGYSLPKSGYARLAVYDLMGRQVEKLVDGAQSAGHYKTTFNANGLTSGVYFYQLSVDGNIVGTQKMLLLR